MPNKIAQEPLSFSARNSSTSNPFHTENIVDCTFPKWWLIQEMVTDEDDDGNTEECLHAFFSLKPSSRYSKPLVTPQSISSPQSTIFIPLYEHPCIFSAWFIPYPINSSFPQNYHLGLSTYPQSHCFPYHLTSYLQKNQPSGIGVMNSCWKLGASPPEC